MNKESMFSVHLAGKGRDIEWVSYNFHSPLDKKALEKRIDFPFWRRKAPSFGKSCRWKKQTSFPSLFQKNFFWLGLWFLHFSQLQDYIVQAEWKVLEPHCLNCRG